jgi:hypothetical protein
MDTKHEKECRHPKCRGHKHVGNECIHKDGTRHKIHECKDCK